MLTVVRDLWSHTSKARWAGDDSKVPHTTQQIALECISNPRRGQNKWTKLFIAGCVEGRTHLSDVSSGCDESCLVSTAIATTVPRCCSCSAKWDKYRRCTSALSDWDRLWPHPTYHAPCSWAWQVPIDWLSLAHDHKSSSGTQECEWLCSYHHGHESVNEFGLINYVLENPPGNVLQRHWEKMSWAVCHAADEVKIICALCPRWQSKQQQRNQAKPCVKHNIKKCSLTCNTNNSVHYVCKLLLKGVSLEFHLVKLLRFYKHINMCPAWTEMDTRQERKNAHKEIVTEQATQQKNNRKQNVQPFSYLCQLGWIQLFHCTVCKSLFHKF